MINYFHRKQRVISEKRIEQGTGHIMRDDWVEVELGDVLIQSKEKHKPDKIKNIFYVGLEHIEKSTGFLTTNVGVEEIKTVKNIFSKGQILYGKLRPYFNKVYLTKEDGVCSTDILVFDVNDNIEDQYIVCYMLSRKFVNDMSANTSGVNLPRVSTKYVITYKFPLAPLPIQRAIVSKIEALFSDLDNGIADIKKAQEQLKVYRQAVLKKAFEGEYCTKKIIEIADVNTGATPKRGNNRYWKNGKIPWITSSALNEKSVNSESELISEIALKETNCKIIPKGSLLVAMYGEGKTRGKCSELNIDAATNQAIATITLYDKYQNSKNFVKWFFYKNYEEIRLLSSGGVQPNLNLSIIKNTIIPFPSHEIQSQIVREIESRLSVCDKVEQSIKDALEKAEALRQSILKKAFEGKLLSEAEIEKCKQESDYEPAAVLLERIKKEKSNGK